MAKKFMGGMSKPKAIPKKSGGTTRGLSAKTKGKKKGC